MQGGAASVPGPEFPRLLRRAWDLAEAASECLRRCDALERETVQRKLVTTRGDYWICGETGQLVRAEFPGALEEMYDERWLEKTRAYQPTEKDRAECRKWLQRIAPHRQTSGGALLEIGSGAGLFLAEARQAGWEAEGDDISAVAAAAARERSGATVHVGPVETLTLAAGRYDVVLCNNVFEHFTQPMHAMKKLAAALRPGGVMFFQTLCGQSLSLWFDAAGWYYYDEGHLYVPTRVSLGHYFQRAGLELVHLETHGFRSARTTVAKDARQKNRVFDKVMAMVAGRVGRGHRVKALLRKR